MKKIFLLFDIIVLDILTKYWAHTTNPDFDVLGDFLTIHHVKNTGVAFGTPLPGISFVIPAILICIGLYVWKIWHRISELEKT